ncbi:leucine-rich repeat domain-containing protein [Baaleninema simplex]|uniref:leucine-rich repeat domain-containing protein n=1 Tax=Baaleninema simplex TaxID=2862350 RepID=UPI00034565A5|nr:leucine-rich repeat domain-containing protein [Baaleninema simplex]
MKNIITVGLLSIFTVIACHDSVLAQSNSQEYQIFADWCRNREQLTPEARHTVEVLLEEAETLECDRAEEILADRTQLWLGDNSIEDLTPLASFTHLKELILISNPIEDLTPLANLTNWLFRPWCVG